LPSFGSADPLPLVARDFALDPQSVAARGFALSLPMASGGWDIDVGEKERFIFV